MKFAKRRKMAAGGSITASASTYENDFAVTNQGKVKKVNRMFSDGNAKDSFIDIGLSGAKGAVTGAVTGFSTTGNPIGALIGAGIGGHLAVGAGWRARRTELNQQAIDDSTEAMNLRREDDARFKTETSNMTSNSLFGSNKTIYAKGGVLPISSNTQKVVGPAHEQGGVDVGAVEMEGEEVIKDGNSVFSDRLYSKKGITFAQEAESLAKVKSELENKKVVGRFAKQGNKRKLDILDEKLDRLFAEQENQKAAMPQQQQPNNMVNEEGKPMMLAGGPYGNFDITKEEDVLGNPTPTYYSQKEINSVTSGNSVGNFAKNNVGNLQYASYFIDNLAAARAIKKLPELAKPKKLETPHLNTTYNIDDALASTNAQIDTANKGINMSTSNSIVANNLKNAMASKGIEAKNSLYGNKSRIETELENQQIQAQNATRNANIQMDNEYANAKVARKADILMMKQANVTQAAEDLQSIIQQKNAENLDYEKIRLMMNKYRESGVYASTMKGLIAKDPTIIKRMSDAEYNELIKNLSEEDKQYFNSFRSK